MKHEEAIEQLELIKESMFNGNTKESMIKSLNYKALNKAIKNMEQCEVYDEPVRMEILDDVDFKSGLVYGMVFNQPILKDVSDENYFLGTEARPIKPKVLEFDEWFEKTYPYNVQSYQKLKKEYTQYLNDNK